MAGRATLTIVPSRNTTPEPRIAATNAIRWIERGEEAVVVTKRGLSHALPEHGIRCRAGWGDAPCEGQVGLHDHAVTAAQVSAGYARTVDAARLDHERVCELDVLAVLTRGSVADPGLGTNRRVAQGLLVGDDRVVMNEAEGDQDRRHRQHRSGTGVVPGHHAREVGASTSQQAAERT